MTPADFQRFYGFFAEAMLLATPEGRIVAANPAVSILIKHSASELIGAELRALAADSPEKVARLLALFSRSGQFMPGALAFKNGDAAGVRCRVEGCALRYPEGLRLLLRLQAKEDAMTRFRSLDERIALLNREILERKQAESALDAQREWLRTTLASIGDGVIATDSAGVISFMNLVAESLTGWSAADAVGQPIGRVFHMVNEYTREPLESPVAEVQRRGVTVGLANHTVLIARDGSERAIADSGAPIYDAGGRMLGVVMVFRDVTQHRRNEAVLRETNKSLQKSNENLRQFAYAVAHDLKEPMRMISLYSQLLAKAYEGRIGGGEEEMFLRQVIGGASRMDELLEGLLAFITAGDLIHEKLEMVDLNEVVAKAVLNLQSMARETAAEVTWDVLPRIRGHAGSLVNVFQNLVANGLKYRRENERPRVNIAASRREREWLVVVEDNGIGIEPEYFQRIFGVFKRLHPAKYPGTGIGLALCAQIVEGHGGTIWVESEPGRGSRFCLTIPD